ncbi:hypothetical protein PVT71_20575 [Salipiger sp. H15]|uniref:Flp family type IVb pilin n=1 Tax=Alloyangia sp. H15 TaxID=3029062 RepID=A0AAU8AMY2_9RHOB
MFVRLKMVPVFAKDIAQRFRRDEDGLALTEYLVVLGLLIGGVIAAVTLFGDNLNIAWTQWAGWILTNISAPGSTVTTPTP